MNFGRWDVVGQFKKSLRATMFIVLSKFVSEKGNIVETGQLDERCKTRVTWSSCGYSRDLS